MEEIIKKADVLIEALPYIRAFQKKIVVIKYGGAVLINEQIRKNILEDIVFMHYVGIRPLLVHGGGKLINEQLKEQGKIIEFINGLRVTDAGTMRVVVRTLEELNKEIVKSVKELGGKARGFGVRHNRIIKARPHSKTKKRVGEIVSVQTSFLTRCFKAGFIPVVSSLGVDTRGKDYNVNADDAAGEIAAALGAEKLVLITDVKGILRHTEGKEELISTLNIEETERLIEESIIQGGMIPKVRACITALNKGVNKTHIVDGKIPHALLLEIFTDRGIGTEIVKER
jgi:acetylglutamate kinase